MLHCQKQHPRCRNPSCMTTSNRHLVARRVWVSTGGQEVRKLYKIWALRAQKFGSGVQVP